MPKISELVSTGIKGLWGTETVFTECGIPVIKTNNLSYEGVIDYTDICYRDIPKDKAEKNYLQNGDILAEKSGGTKTHSVGYVSYFDGESNKFVCNNFILALRPNREKCLSKYLFYQMRYMYENGIFADCYNRTTGIQNLQVGEYLGKSVKNPVIEEQEQAVSMLDAIVSQIDNAKERLSALDELVKSRFIEMFGDIVRNDLQWETDKLSTLCPIKNYRGEIPTINGKYWLLNLDLVESNTGKVLAKNYVYFDEIGNSTITFSEEYVLYSKLRPYLNKVVLPDGIGYATSELIPFLPSVKINKYYLAYALRSDNFVALINDKSGGAKMPRAPMDFVKAFPLPIPPISLQNEFADFVKLIDKSKFIVQQQIKDLQELLDSKMDEYFR